MATAYYEIVVEGNRDVARGFVLGFEAGSASRTGLWLCDDLPVAKAGSKAVRRFRADHTRLVCTAAFRRVFLAALAKAQNLPLKILWDEKIERARFDFGFKTVSREAASGIKKLLASPPAGVKLVGYEPQETVDKTARGAELYSPAPEYEFRGEGRAEGAFEPVLSFRTKLAANEFFELGDIVLDY